MCRARAPVASLEVALDAGIDELAQANADRDEARSEGLVDYRRVKILEERLAHEISRCVAFEVRLEIEEEKRERAEAVSDD